MSGENCLITAAGYGTTTVKVGRVSYGLNIIATEEQAATSKYLYTRQVQTDVFTLQVIFTTISERHSFVTWFQGFAQLAITPSPVGTMQVQIPSRQFNMYGTLTTGVEEDTTPSDVIWTMSLTFNGAFFPGQNSYVNDPTNSIYQAPGDKVASQFFYPVSSNLNGPSYSPAQTATATPTTADIQATLNKLTHLFDQTP